VIVATVIAAARITFATFAMISFSAVFLDVYRHAQEQITSTRIPSQFLEYNAAELRCMLSAADCGAGAVAEAVNEPEAKRKKAAKAALVFEDGTAPHPHKGPFR
jgi:hypothetical protein